MMGRNRPPVTRWRYRLWFGPAASEVSCSSNRKFFNFGVAALGVIWFVFGIALLV
jgi:hypothetical protein